MRITKIETGTAKNGNPMKRIYLSEKTNDKDMLFIFGDHTRFNDVEEGMELASDDVEFDGQYLKLVDPNAGIKGRSKSGAVTAAQNRKADMIHDAQQAKEESIRLSSTIRMAVDITVAEMQASVGQGIVWHAEDVKKSIERWRSYFYHNWNTITQDEPPFPPPPNPPVDSVNIDNY